MLHSILKFVTGFAGNAWGYAAVIATLFTGYIAIHRQGKIAQTAEDNIKRLDEARERQERIRDAIAAGDAVVKKELDLRSDGDSADADGLRKPVSNKPVKLERHQRD